MITKQSWFLPFNKGYNDGAGNPPNPHGIATDYLWREILLKNSLTEILENYAQVVVKKNDKTGKKERKQIFPRYHQLSVVRKLRRAAAKVTPSLGWHINWWGWAEKCYLTQLLFCPYPRLFKRNS